MAGKLKVGDKIKIRKIEFQILSDQKTKSQRFYFLSQGARQLLRDLGITKQDSPLVPNTSCKTDEYELANRFSKVPASWVERNPVRATSLVKLQEFIDYIISVSDTIPETEEEKRANQRNKRREKTKKLFHELMEISNGFGFAGPHGIPPEIIAIFEMSLKAKKANKKLKKKVKELEERLSLLENQA